MMSLANTSTSNNLNYSSGSDESFMDNPKQQQQQQSNNHQFISDKMCLIIYELAHIRPALLDLVMPQIEYKLKSSELKERREYTKLMSKMFAERDSRLAQQHQQLWEAYLERFADANEEIRRICIQQIGDFLVQQADALKASFSADLSTSNIQSVSRLVFICLIFDWNN